MLTFADVQAIKFSLRICNIFRRVGQASDGAGEVLFTPGTSEGPTSHGG